MPQVKEKAAMKPIRCSCRTRGFTLVELLLSMVLGGILLSTITFIFANMAGSFAERPATNYTFSNFGWPNTSALYAQPISYTPAYSQLPAAFALQAAITEEMQATSANDFVPCVYVVTNSDTTGGKLPSSTSAPTTFAWMTALPTSQVSSSAQFAALLNTNGVLTEASTGYSIYFISSKSTVDMVIHCRRTDEADGVTIYTVLTYLNGSFADNLSYAYGIATTQENTCTPVYPSAKHIMLRTSPSAWTYGVSDELGAQVIFPDPTAFPYQVSQNDTTAQVRTFSRFVMLLPVNP